MNELIIKIFGEGVKLTAMQMGARVFVMFFITLAMIRIAGIRTFGTRSAFDNVVVIMLGAILSRAVTGASPFFSVVIAGFVICIVHRIVAFASLKSHTIGRMVKGREIILFRNGQLFRENMRHCNISMGDMLGEVRLHGNINSLDEVKEILLERTGEISIVKKEEKTIKTENYDSHLLHIKES